MQQADLRATDLSRPSLVSSGCSLDGLPLAREALGRKRVACKSEYFDVLKKT